ncbi:MAG: pyridoxal-phosphate dependent enzyme [Acidobacteriota bacterium]|nr:pyridoxal-phosphate dependent enzyme [Acidobacteriota bacterium]
MNAAALLAALDAHPRLDLGGTDSPFEPFPLLEELSGRPAWIKRDDTLGPAPGGNKTRKLEYLLAEARRRGARRVATFGALTSNHTRLTAVLAREVGLEAHLFFFDHRPAELTGSLALAAEAGAQLHFFPAFRSLRGKTRLETASRMAHALCLARLGRHYFIPVGGHGWRGALGYVRAAVELHRQARAAGLGPARVGLATGTGGTLAGLMAGLALLDSPLQPLGIDVGGLWRRFRPSIARLAGEVCRRLGSARPFPPESVPLVEERYVGPGYGSPLPLAADPGARAAAAGLHLDPVYTAKALAGLADLVRRGAVEGAGALIFLHTGGLPSPAA